jgi:ABC-type transporter Mla subunit MlaD
MNIEKNQINLSGLFPDFSTLAAYPETAEQLSAQFVAVLISVAILFLLISLISALKANYRINWVRKSLKNETSKSVVMNRQGLRDKASKVRHNAGHLWKEFDETLVEARAGEEVHLYNIYDASHFFNGSTIARGTTESRMLAAVPGFLTALGVIGTFVGLQLGLSELNIGNDAAVQDMKAGLAHVISGAKIAFMTSVWGVSLSVLFNFVEKWLESFTLSRIHRLQVRIDEIFPRFSAEVQLQKIAEDGSESREALQGLAERIGEKMQESLIEATNGIQRGLEASLEKIMAPAINKLVNETTDGSQKALEQLVHGFMDKFGEQGDTQRKAMDEASKGVGEALFSMTQTLEGLFDNLEQNQNAAFDREQQLTEHISHQLDELVEKNSKHGKLLVTETKQQIEKISETLGQSRQAQEKREINLGEKFERTVSGMGESIDRQAAASNTLLEKGKALQQQVEASQANFETLAQGIHEGATELRSAADRLNEYGDGVRHSSQQLGSVIQEAARSTAELASENQKSSTAVGKVHQQISNDIEALREVIENLGSVVQTADSTFANLEEHQQRYLATLKENVQELAEQGSKLLSDYAEQANAQTGEHLNLWARHTTDYAEQMNEAARALSTVVDEIEDKLGR